MYDQDLNNSMSSIGEISISSLDSVMDYLNILLVAESKSHPQDDKILNAKITLESIFLNKIGVSDSILNKPATDLNLTAFLLSLEKKNKSIGKYYKNLIHEYSNNTVKLRQEQDYTNIYDLVENLLDKANIIVHPDNQVNKYFNDTNYAFSCGVRLEPIYKYVPDKSLQDLVQQTMRLRVAFLTTLIQMRTKYTDLWDIYYANGVYSREISLCILFHSLTIAISDSFNTKTLEEQYKRVKELVLEDIEKGRLQLPERRLFKLNSIRKRLILKKEFKKNFLNEVDFTKNNLLKIIFAFSINLQKFQDQVFPVAMVKDPISGKIMRVGLTKYGIKAQTLKETKIDPLKMLSDTNIEDFMRVELAKELSNMVHESLPIAVEKVTGLNDINSPIIQENIVSTLKSNIYEKEGWNRKLLFFIDNFDKTKTTVGNIVLNVVSQSLLPVIFKQRIEAISNIPTASLFATLIGLGIGGIPGATVMGVSSFGLVKLFEEKDIEDIYADIESRRDFAVPQTLDKSNESNSYNSPFWKLSNIARFSSNLLEKPYNGIRKVFLKYESVEKYNEMSKTNLLDKDSFKVLSSNNKNPYASMISLMLSKDKTFLNTFAGMFSSYDSKIRFIRKANTFGGRFKNFAKFIGGITVNTFFSVGNKVGVANSYSQDLRKYTENLEYIKTISQSKFDKSKREEAYNLLSLISKNKLVFGYKKALLARSMFNTLDTNDSSNLNKDKFRFNILKWIFIPNYEGFGSNNRIYSFASRYLSLGIFKITREIKTFTQRNGGDFIRQVSNFSGQFSGNLSTRVLNIGGAQSLNKTTIRATGIFITLMFIIFLMLMTTSPILVANKTAYGSASNLSSPSLIGNPVSEANKTYLKVAYINEKVDKNNKDIPYGGAQMCGAASALMVASYYNKIPLNNDSIDNLQQYLTEDRGQKATYPNLQNYGNPQNCGSGAFYYASENLCDQTHTQGLEDYLTKGLGLHILQREYGLDNLDTKEAAQRAYIDVKTSIDQNHPLILSIKLPQDHIMSIIGYTHDDAGNVTGVIANDPYRDMNINSNGPYESNGNRVVYDLTKGFLLYYILSVSP